MKSSKIILTAQQRDELFSYLKDKALAWQVVKRLEVIRLLDKGCTTAMVAQQLALRKEQVRKYASQFEQGGFDQLIRMEKPGKETMLTEEIFQALEAYQKNQKKYCSLKDLTGFLLQTYGISMSEEWLSKRLAMRKEALKTAPWR